MLKNQKFRLRRSSKIGLKSQNVTKQGGNFNKPCFFSQIFLACGAFELHVIDQVDVFLRLDHSSQELLYENLDLNTIGKLNSQLQVNEIIKVINNIDNLRLAKILDHTNSNISADVLQTINNRDITDIVSKMEKREDVEPLLGFDDDIAGGLMATELLAVRDDFNIGQILSNEYLIIIFFAQL